MLDQPLAHDGALADEDVHDPLGDPGLETELTEPDGRERRELGGLEDDRVPARERGPELPARDVRREVPGDDEPDHAERLAERRGDAACYRDRLAEVLVDRAGVEVEHLRDHADLAAGAGDRLADVLGLDPGELFEVVLDQAREPPQEPRAIGRGDRAPAGIGGLRARDGRVGLLHPCLLELGDRLLGGRVQDGQRHGPDSNTGPLQAAALPHAPDSVDDPREHGGQEERNDPEGLADARESRCGLAEHVRDEEHGQREIDDPESEVVHAFLLVAESVGAYFVRAERYARASSTSASKSF